MVLLGKDHHGIRGADALIATARIAHDGNHGASHTRIAGAARAGEDVREDAVAHYAAAQWARESLAQAVAVVARERLLGSCFVETARLLNEFDFGQRRSGGKVVHLAHIQRERCVLVLCGRSLRYTIGGVAQVKRGLSVARYIYKVCMAMGYHHFSLVALVIIGMNLHIEFAGRVFLEPNLYAVFGNIRLALLNSLGRAVAQDLQPIGRTSHDGAKGNGNGQSHHACARDAHAHSVLENIGTQFCLDARGATS